jgi:BirA family biotin operon repressor/biotin-[acetyl-CoA-carboxylase] ligase
MFIDERSLRNGLIGLPLGDLRFFVQTGSTNDLALVWAAEGAADLSLVCAEEQTAGRGRGDHRWFTPAGTALAFSLVLRPMLGEEQSIQLFSGLGSLAVCEALELHGLKPEIKWPNDVLLNGSKVCGVLAEAVWLGDKTDCVILGIGVNIDLASVPPPDQLLYPATCVEAELHIPVDRMLLLREILTSLLTWRDLLTGEAFLTTWQNHLAFRSLQVEIWADGLPVRTGKVEGLEQDGSLRLLTNTGQTFTVHFGEVHLVSLL